MKLIYYSFIIFSSFSNFAQEIPFSRKTIENIFRQNERGKTHGFKKNERGQYGESLMSKYDIWYSDKENDNKPTRDTIKLYNHREYKSHCNCPEMTAWNLFGSKAVNFSNVAGNRGTVNSEWYKLKITEQNNKIDMHIIKDDEIVKSYTVLKLELTYLNSDPIEPMYILTLKRN